MKHKNVRIGVVGFGYWSPKIIRNFLKIPEVEIVSVCDKNELQWKAIAELVPRAKIERHYEDLVLNEAIDAVVITTTVESHYRIAKAALQAGKHVLVEKPMTETVRQAREIRRLAEKRKLVLMVDHTFLYSPAVQALKNIIDEGRIGSLVAISGKRTNLGLFQKDVDVVYDLAPHDFSIVHYLVGGYPNEITVHSVAPIKHPRQKASLASIAHITMEYSNGPLVHIEVSWLSPIKDRRFVVVGDRGMAVYDMQDKEGQLKIYNTHVDLKEVSQPYDAFFEHIAGAPEIVPLKGDSEDLARVTSDFVTAILKDAKPVAHAGVGEAVVHMLERTRKTGHLKRLTNWLRAVKEISIFKKG